jgi:hypothetical protein
MFWKMKHKFLILSLLLIPCMLHAQVDSFSIDASDNSIVRDAGTMGSLVYSERSSTEAYFLLYQDGAAVAQRFRLPVGFQVRDVRIYDDRQAYFCGTYASHYAVVGTFSIAGVFSGTDAIYFSLYYPPYTDELTGLYDLKRLELYESSDLGNVCMAMVGTAQFDYIAPDTTTTVVSAYFDGSDWQWYALLHKADLLKYTDITCLRSSVVAVGSDLTGRDCYVETFRPTSQFPNAPFLPNHIQKVTYGFPAGDVLITHLLRDTAVLVHFDSTDEVRTTLHKIGIDHSTGAIVLPTVSAWVTAVGSSVPYNSHWQQVELRSVDQRVHLFQRANHPASLTSSIDDWLLMFDFTSPTGPTTPVDAWRPVYTPLQSMDVGAQSPMRASAQIQNLHLYGPAWYLMDDACSFYTPIELASKGTVVNNTDYNPLSRTNIRNNFTITPTIDTVLVERVCNHYDLH